MKHSPEVQQRHYVRATGTARDARSGNVMSTLLLGDELTDDVLAPYVDCDYLFFFYVSCNFEYFSLWVSMSMVVMNVIFFLLQ